MPGKNSYPQSVVSPYSPATSTSIMRDGMIPRKEPMAKRSPLAEKVDEIRERIARAAAKAKRDPGEITLIAVTKTAAPEQIREVVQLGVADLGESRVQVLTQRASQLNEFFQRRVVHGDGMAPQKTRWHMIGH